MHQRQASPHTIASYRDSFRLLLQFAQKRLNKAPSSFDLADLNAELIEAFLGDLQQYRAICARTRNLRLTAIRAFFRYAALQVPTHSGHIQRVLALCTTRTVRAHIDFLTREEINALLSVPDRSIWLGRRDHALLLLALQTGLRLSELIGLDRQSVTLGTGAHVRCHGKGRKERSTPLVPPTPAVLKAWLKEPPRKQSSALFPTIHGDHMSPDAVQYLLRKYVAIAARRCPSLKRKRVSPHVLRHSAAMELLLAGVHPSVIALCLGHESMETTQIYIHEHLAFKEAALAKTVPAKAAPARYRPSDPLIHFLEAL
jgi:site-specific recombinase XerD